MKTITFEDKAKGLVSDVEDIVMGIDADSHVSLMSSMTNLYSDPPLAALREYVANAADAHKAIGQVKPFEVSFTSPYAGNTAVRVKDFGAGLNREELSTIYSQYGATTKKDNNKLVGGFGLGSKSGLAVSKFFFLHTVKDGIRIEAQILKNEEGISVLRILSEAPTSEKSGTEIILPMKPDQIRHVAENIKAHLVGYGMDDVTVNGKRNVYSVHNNEIFIPIRRGNEIVAWIQRVDAEDAQSPTFVSGRVNHSYSARDALMQAPAVMGGVYYQSFPLDSIQNPMVESITNALRSYFQSGHLLILNVPVGSVNLPPHRDALIDTAKTRQTVANLLAGVQGGIDSSCSTYLNSLSFEEAVKVVAFMPTVFAPEGKWSYRGETFNNNFVAGMEHPPYAYIKGAYGYSTSLWHRLNEDNFTMMHVGTTTTHHVHFGYPVSPHNQMKTINLIVPKKDYEKAQAYAVQMEKNRKAQSIDKMPHPAIKGYFEKYLIPVAGKLFSQDNFLILISCEGKTVIPAHIESAINMTVHKNELRARFLQEFPPAPAPKSAKEKHVVFSEQKLAISEVHESTKMVYFGGKGMFRTESYIPGKANGEYTQRLKHAALGAYAPSGAPLPIALRDTWLQEGLLPLIDEKETLVLLSNDKSPRVFAQEFANARPLATIIRERYESYDDAKKLAVQHALSLLIDWTNHTDNLFTLFKGKGHDMANPAIGMMFDDAEVRAIAYYLLAFKDNHIDGFSKWKENIISEMSGKELASDLLFPVNLVLCAAFEPRNPVTTKELDFPRAAMKLTSRRNLKIDELGNYVSKLTA